MTIAGMILVNNPNLSKIYPRCVMLHGLAVPYRPYFLFYLLWNGHGLFLFKIPGRDLSMGSGYVKLYKRPCSSFSGPVVERLFFPYKTDPDLTFWGKPGQLLFHLRIFECFSALPWRMPWEGPGIMAEKAASHHLGFRPGFVVSLGPVILFWGDDPYSRETNFARVMDLFLVGPDHLYRGYGLPFDPEGVLGMLSGAGTVLMGYLAGICIRRNTQKLKP